MAMERTNVLRAGVAALIAGLVVSQGALAESSVNAETVHRAIDLRALNLSSPAGAQEAYKRIAAGCSDDEKYELFAGSAARFYQLGDARALSV